MATLVSAAAAGATVAELYRQGVAARDAGDLVAAARAFEQALVDDPDNVEALLQLGIVYSWQERWTDALDLLGRARERAPDYADIVIQVARIRNWQGQFAEARRELDDVLSRQPGRTDARLLRATVNRRLGDPAAAEQDYSAVMADDPDMLEVLIGLADIAAERGDRASAERLYRRAAESHPEAEIPRARLAGSAPENRWRLDGGVTYSTFSREDRDDWWRETIGIAYRFSPDTSAGLISESEDRGFGFDQHFGAALDHRFNEIVGGRLGGGFTLEADFREKWLVDIGGRLRLRDTEAPIGATWLRLDGRYSAYDSGDVKTLKPALVQYLASSRLWLTLQQISIWDEDGRYVAGWLTRADAQLSDRLHAFAGAASAPETQAGRTVDTFSAFAGLDFEITGRVVAHLAYAREDRNNSYIRHVATGSLTVRF